MVRWCLVFRGIVTLILYAIAFICLLLSFKREGLQPVFYAAMLAALAAHLYVLYQLIDTPTGQNLNVFNLFSLTTALWVGILCIANLKISLKSLFIVVLPLAGLSLVAALKVRAPGVPIALGEHPLALWHILSALAAYALLGVAFLQAMALALQRRYLSEAPAHGALRFLPPLESMQTLMMAVILAAFVALSLALILGVLAHAEAGIVSFKNVVSLGVWGLCALLLGVYYRFGLTVRYAILGTGIAWIGLSMAYLWGVIW